MKSSLRRRALATLAAFIGATAFAGTAQAVPLFWDGTGTGWNSTTSWSTSQTATTPDPGAVPGSADIATFNTTGIVAAQIVNLNNDQAALGLATFAGSNNLGTTLIGGGANRTLSLGASGISHVASGGALTIGSTTANQAVNIGLTDSQTWDSSTSGTGAVAIFVLNGVSSTTAGAKTLTLTGGNNGTKIDGFISDGSGVVSLVKSGGGTSVWTLNGANTFSGGVTINAGTLRLNNATAIGSGALTINGGGIDATVATVLTTNNAQNWNANFSFTGGNTLNLGTGAVTMNTARTITTTASTLTVGGVISGAGSLNALDVVKAGAGNLVLSNATAIALRGGGQTVTSNAGTTTIAAPISGADGITKAGDGNLELTGTNTYAGKTVVTGGILSINTDASLGAVPVSPTADQLTLNTGTTLRYLAGMANPTNRGITLAGNSTINIAHVSGTNTSPGPITGPGQLTVSLTNTGLYVSNRQHTYTGGTVLSSSSSGFIVPTVSSTGLPGAVTSGPFGTGPVTFNGAAFRYTSGGTGPYTLANDIVFAANTTFVDSGLATIFSGPISLTGNHTITQSSVTGSYTFSNVISDGAGVFGFTKAGAGNLILTAANTYDGATAVSAGTLTLSNNLALQNSALNTTGAGSVVLNAAVTAPTLGGLAGGVNLATKITTGYSGVTTLTLKPLVGATNTYSGVIANGAAGMNLTKSGAGTQDLSGTNSYTGATLVSEGTLSLSGTGAINTTTGITINGSDAKFLQTSSVAATPAITLTQGTLTGSGTVGNVTVGAGTGGIVSNNDGLPGAALTTGNLQFTGTATVNTFSSSTSAPLIASALTTNGAGTVTINPSATTWTNGSTYDLISYTGGSIGGAGFSQFTLGTVVGTSVRQSAILGNTGSAITLAIAGDTPYWTGAANGNWNTTDTNWKLVTAGTNTQFLVGDDVLFNDNATGTTTIDINTANVAPNSIVFNNTTALPYTIGSTGGFGITTGSLTKNNSGTVTISTANTYAGPTAITAGILNLNGSLSGTAITVSGSGELSQSATGVISGESSLTHTSSGTSTLAGANTYTGATAISAGTVNLTGSLAGTAITVSGTGVLTQTSTGVISGSIGLTHTSTGTSTLAGTNTYSGATTLGAGILNATSSAALGDASATNTLIFTGGTLQAGGAITSPAARTVTLTSTGTIDTNGNPVSIAGAISGAGGLTKTGLGTLTFTGAKTYTGNTTISAGTLAMNGNLITASPLIIIGDGATLSASPGVDANFGLAAGQSIQGTGITGSFTTGSATGNGVLTNSNTTISSTGTLTFNRLEIRGTGNQITGGDIVSGVSGSRRGLLVGNSSAGALTISGGTLTTIGGSVVDIVGANGGAGTLIINGGAYVNNGTLNLGFGGTSSTVTITMGSAAIGKLQYDTGGGNATVNLDSGSLTLSEIEVLSGATKVLNFNGGQFIAGANLPTVTGLTLNVKDGGANINTNGNSFAIGDPLLTAGTGGLNKTGAGTLTLSGASTYTGASNVSAGTLRVNGSLQSVVNVSAGTLDGTGNGLTTGLINSNVVIGNSTGVSDAILAPGNSVGTLTAAGSLTFNSDALFALEVDSFTGTFDKMVANGVTIDPAAIISLVDIGTPTVLANGVSFVVIENTGLGSITSTFANLPNLGTISDGTNLYQANYSGGFGGNDLVFTVVAIPEPSTLVLCGLALLGFAGAGLRRRRMNVNIDPRSPSGD